MKEKVSIEVSSQKEGGSGVLWTGAARPQHPTPRFIEKIPIEKIIVLAVIALFTLGTNTAPTYALSGTEAAPTAPSPIRQTAKVENK